MMAYTANAVVGPSAPPDEAWDRQFEADVKAGKLDTLAERALRDHRAGRSTRL